MLHTSESFQGDRRGFTLIELLVVISILVLLISLLLPALRQARETAHTVVCLSNLRQIAMALQGYRNDNRNLAPPNYVKPPLNPATPSLWGERYDPWHVFVAPYFAVEPKGISKREDAKGPWWCSSWVNQFGSIVRLWGNERGSYNYNGDFHWYGPDDWPLTPTYHHPRNGSIRFGSGVRFHDILNPSRVAAFADAGIFYGVGITNPFPISYRESSVVPYGMVYDDPNSSFNGVLTKNYGGMSFPHNDRGNALFLDGHGETMSFETAAAPYFSVGIFGFKVAR